MANRLILAVAGSRKTQGIVDHCASLTCERRAVIVTYTQRNQTELRARLRDCGGGRPTIVVTGWFTFLLREFARPFIPLKFPEARVRGFNFDGRPHMYAAGINRFLDQDGAVYKSELGRLAYELIIASDGASIRRLECMYDEIHIDEVQDLSGYDWEVVDALLRSRLDVQMVGDIRQAVLSTNPRGQKNKKYAYAEVIGWFREREAAGLIEIVENSTTWRCRPEIAHFSDSIFDSSWPFPQTASMNHRVTGHDGVFLVHPKNVFEYMARYRPQCLRDSANSGKKLNLDYMNFGQAKGATFSRVLVVPTDGIQQFVKSGKVLAPVSAARFYVAVTRAEQSVAIVLDDPGGSCLPWWHPEP